MKGSGTTSLTALAAIAVAGLVFGNTDLGGGSESDSASLAQTSGVEEEQAQSGGNFADDLRSFIGGAGAGLSKESSGFFDQLSIGDGESSSGENTDKGVWEHAEEYGADNPSDGLSGGLSSLFDSSSSGAETRQDAGQGQYTDVDIAASWQKLENLEIKGRAPKTGYDRDLFGPAWTDDVDVAMGRDGCDTRSNLLGISLDDVVFKEGTGNCKPLSGTLNDPYTGKKIAFTSENGRAIHIDHVVALSDAWQKGAQQWDSQTRVELANDPDNLIAVDGPTNMSKGDGDAATWQPPNKTFRCEYAAMQINVKDKYGLWVTQAEYDALSANLDRC